MVEYLLHKSARGEIRVLKKVDEIEYAVSSESENRKQCRIMRLLGRWCHACKSFVHTNRACKHVVVMKGAFSPAEPRPDSSRRRRRREAQGVHKNT